MESLTVTNTTAPKAYGDEGAVGTRSPLCGKDLELCRKSPDPAVSLKNHHSSTSWSPLESGVLSHAEVKQAWRCWKGLRGWLRSTFLVWTRGNCLKVKETSLRNQISLQEDKQEKKETARTSLVVHWLRICLPVQAGHTGPVPGRGRPHMPRST